jgi:hypothetical protein
MSQIPVQIELTGAPLLEAVYEFLGRFVAYPSDACRVAHVLWVAHAHLMETWDSTPRLAFLSPEPGSGKSRALEVTELLVPRPVETVNVTPAYLFRKVASEEGRPTILFDEIDTVFGPMAKGNEETRGLINAGHRRGAFAGRCVVRGKIVETEEIPAYCAVAMAGLGTLPDTILTRSVVVRMRRRARGEQVEPFRRREVLPRGDVLRGALDRWARRIEGSLSGAWPSMPDEIKDRDADVWEALLAVADAAGGRWPQIARVSAVTLVTATKGDTPSLGIRLLADLRSIWGDASNRSTSELLDVLNGMIEAPWGDLRGKPLDDRALAAWLRPYEIKPKTVRTSGGTAKGYARDELTDAWDRYLGPPAQKSVTSVTSGTYGGAEPDVPQKSGGLA